MLSFFSAEKVVFLSCTSGSVILRAGAPAAAVARLQSLVQSGETTLPILQFSSGGVVVNPPSSMTAIIVGVVLGVVVLALIVVVVVLLYRRHQVRKSVVCCCSFLGK